ncbi:MULTISPECIES: metallophosphoesterase [unclassified Flavobacterium]|uniref:metallophosphoesterase n=1 Tax=unclassified Flavobacterium TaxID=196869 RepID=UPI003F8F08DC
MKLFFDYSCIKKNIFKYSPVLLPLLFLQSCATYHAQYGSKIEAPKSANDIDTSKVSHTFYLIGDAGYADELATKITLNNLQDNLIKSDKNATLLFLGDNIYPVGMPDKENKKGYKSAENKLLNQLKLSQGFKGNTMFIPGNHDWYSGIKGLERQEKYVTDYLKDKNSFSPRNGCPIEEHDINDKVMLITIDSQWFLLDWDNVPTINENCDIKNREAFFEELESTLSKNEDKTIILAIHHPLISNGTHGNQFSLKKQLFPFQQKIPLPIIGSLINLVRKTSGFSPQDIQNKQYTLLAKRIKTILQGQDNVIVVSGHEHNLQYIDKDNIKQIISGSGSKSEVARAVFPYDFSYSGNGYAIMKVYKKGDVKVSYFANQDKQDKLLFEKTVIKVEDKKLEKFPTNFPAKTTTSIYTKEMTDKSWFYRLFFGKHYRKYYSMPVEVKTATIDTLMGGMVPKRAGGGHQTRSLQLVNKDGKEFVLRAMKKSVSSFVQSVAFKDQYVVNEFKNTYAEGFLYDFYTTAHPYTPFAISNLASKIGVAHTNPKLYYVPKHKALQEYNEEFGDELYMFEERTDETQKDLKSFGKPEDIISTEDLLEKLHKDEKYSVDEKEYIKARLFDMLIGDWDRHYDQWRWGEYKVKDKVVYKPIPRDRDQAFTKYDGALLSVLMTKSELKHMQTFKDHIKKVKWLNREPYPLDLAFLKTADKEDWIKQAKYIQNQLSDAEIDAAFKNLPVEVQDATIEDIKRKLKLRKNDLQKYTAIYFQALQKTVLIVGTNKDDKFVIDHNKKNNIKVDAYRLKKEGDELMYSKNYSASSTKNIWVYGLDDKDQFEIKGNAKTSTKIKLIGGLDKDQYKIENGKRLTIYDFKSKDNNYDLDNKTKTVLTDDYSINQYDYTKPKFNSFSKFPVIGYNPDDGLKLVLLTKYLVNGFKQNPYTQKHTLKANYYFATNGYDLIYNGHLPKLFKDWDFNVEARLTSPNFSINYFGAGNETVNEDQQYGLDYNRVKIRILKFAPSIMKFGRYGSEINFQTSFERIKVEETTDRYINLPTVVNQTVFDGQHFGGATLKYSFENYDVVSLPTMGLGFSLAGSWTTNLRDGKRNFPTIESHLNINHRIDSNGKLVLATMLKSKVILNDNYEFYQGATLGGDYDLRGFRNERFLGRQSFYQSTDLRWNLGKIKRSIIPMSYGILGGFDYGRVWTTGENSDKWHQSFGGGLWLNGLNVVTARLTYFKSQDDRPRIAFGLGFGF